MQSAGVASTRSARGAWSHRSLRTPAASWSGSLRRNIKKSRPNSHVASSSSEDRIIKLPITNWEVPEKYYTALELGLLLVQLGIADAGFSGDWSRIGVISHETEQLLQKLFIFIVSAHALVGLGCAYIAGGKGRNAPIAFIKGLLFGSMALAVEMMPEEESK